LLGPGDHRVWIGEYSDGQSSSFSLSVDFVAAGTTLDATGLSPGAAPSGGTIDLSQQGASGSTSGMVNGTIDGHTLGSNCRGYYTSAPTAQIHIPDQRFVSITTTSTADDAMVLRGANGLTLCDDDSGEGSNPLIANVFEPGDYQVWIGPYGQSSTIQYTLSVASEAVMNTSDPSGLAPEARPLFGSIDLDTEHGNKTYHGVTMHRLEYTASPCGAGFMASPSVGLESHEPRHVVLNAQANRSVALLIRDAQGTFRCEAGRRGQTMFLPYDMLPGTTLIWVGTSDREGHALFTLSIAGPPVATPLVPAGRTTGHGTPGSASSHSNPNGR
jgi:hypothetical protein